MKNLQKKMLKIIKVEVHSIYKYVLVQTMPPSSKILKRRSPQKKKKKKKIKAGRILRKTERKRKKEKKKKKKKKPELEARKMIVLGAARRIAHCVNAPGQS